MLHVPYALSYFYGHTWYCISDEDYNYYPRWNPSVFFEITDAHLSRYWIFSFQSDDKTQKEPFIGFPEWANDEYYYSRLIDGDHSEREIFQEYKKCRKKVL